MPYSDDSEDIECSIVELYGIFSQGIKFWNKEVNLVSWNGRPAKIDIRNWQRDHQKCGKGIALTREEAEELVKLLNSILSKPKSEKTKARTFRKPDASGAAKTSRSARASGAANTYGTEKTSGNAGYRPVVPKVLEPFYKELKLGFGADPGKCKTARNTLLKKYHPDTSRTSTAYATGKTIKIKEAYEKIIGWWKTNGFTG